jgi:hypothetical protein
MLAKRRGVAKIFRGTVKLLLLKDARKCLEIACVSVLLARHPVLRAPEEVCIKRSILPGPAHTGVIVVNNL